MYLDFSDPVVIGLIATATIFAVVGATVSYFTLQKRIERAQLRVQLDGVKIGYKQNQLSDLVVTKEIQFTANSDGPADIARSLWHQEQWEAIRLKSLKLELDLGVDVEHRKAKNTADVELDKLKREIDTVLQGIRKEAGQKFILLEAIRDRLFQAYDARRDLLNQPASPDRAKKLKVANHEIELLLKDLYGRFSREFTPEEPREKEPAGVAEDPQD